MENELKCDQCGQLVNEAEGYVKSESRLLMNFCQRVGGVLEIKKIADDNEQKRVCMSCINRRANQ